MDSHIMIEWRVTWFPYDRDRVTRTGTESYVRKLADEHAEFNPIIETRKLIAEDWVIVP